MAWPTSLHLDLPRLGCRVPRVALSPRSNAEVLPLLPPPCPPSPAVATTTSTAAPALTRRGAAALLAEGLRGLVDGTLPVRPKHSGLGQLISGKLFMENIQNVLGEIATRVHFPEMNGLSECGII